MSQHEKPMKISKHLRLKAQDFLTSRKYANNLVEIVKHLDSGSDTSACLLTLDLIFGSVLKSRQMFVEVVPLKLAENTAENMYRKWLLNIYDDVTEKVLYCIGHSSNKVHIQALTTAMNLLSNEGKFPLESKSQYTQGVPLVRLKNILSKLLHAESNSALLLLNKFEEYLLHNDILYNIWRILPKITLKSNPSEQYISNYLLLLEKLPLQANEEVNLLCFENAESFNFDSTIPRKNLNKIWSCVMLWQYSVSSHKQLLILLLEKVLSNLDKPLLLTDFLMDSLDVGGPVSLLALQGIFTLIQMHNLDYPNIYSKLYSMFEPEIFHTKYKSRLFHLSDLFLSSTHLPETLVAAFAKRLARLALIAPPLDATIICMFIGNLILRHPGLKTLIHHPSSAIYSVTDPYIMDESDPIKSNAINSSLWEIKSLQQHVLPSVAEAAAFINKPLPKVEFDMHKYLDLLGGDDVFDREIKRNRKLVALAIEKPTLLLGDGGAGGHVVGQYFVGC